VPNTTTRINQLKAGEVHVVALVPWDQVRELRPLRGIILHRMAGNSYEHITLNQRRFPPFAELAVRRALAHAIDRELIVRSILDTLAPVIHGPIQPVSWAYTDSVRHYSYDPARARTLLDEADWRDTDGDGVRDRQGLRLGFTLITQAGYAIRENVAQVVQRQLREIGVDVRIQLIDGTAISTVWFAGNFDAMLHWWHMPPDPELTLFFAADRMPPAGRNINYVNDAALTDLLYASDRTVDQAERRRLLVLAQQRIAEIVPEIPLYNVTRIDAVPASLLHFKGNPTNTGIFWNVYEWDLR